MFRHLPRTHWYKRYDISQRCAFQPEVFPAGSHLNVGSKVDNTEKPPALTEGEVTQKDKDKDKSILDPKVRRFTGGLGEVFGKVN